MIKGWSRAVIVSGTIGLAACVGSASTSSSPQGSTYLPHATVVGAPDLTPSPTPSCQRPTLIGTASKAIVAARRAPDPSARRIASFASPNVEGARQVFDVVGELTGTDGAVWYRVLLPIRPNGTEGFVPATSLHLSQTEYRLVVDRSRLRLTLWDGCRVARRYPIGLGTSDTPTPVGTFYLVALVRPPTPDSVYGSYAYGLSAYSDALTNWTGGGIIGLHGTNDPSSIGQRKSHGCIRMLNRNIESLIRILPLGTPIEIR